ncbi:MoeA, N-terminal and linker domain-containing protein [Trichoderma barbatum]
MSTRDYNFTMSENAESIKSWAAAIKMLQHTADEIRSRCICNRPGERVLLKDAVGRKPLADYISQGCTPKFDTSAMDGFAISSVATHDASLSHPILFRVVGTITPGNELPSDIGVTTYGMEPCAEIMTGGRFPDCAGPLGQLDACVKIEDVTMVEYGNSDAAKQWRCILVTKPVQQNAHRRFAGNDIQNAEILVTAGQRILSSHLMPLASLGLREVEVMKRVRIGIWSTGNEFVEKTTNAVDVNGPFLQAASTEYGAEANFLGYLDDEIESLSQAISCHACSGKWDALITSGAASVGKFDFIRTALEECGADVIFHGLSIRPGHPVLFALIDHGEKPTAFFGLPGNPGAAAACFRFIVIPYLRRLEGRKPEEPISAKVVMKTQHADGKCGRNGKLVSTNRTLDCFWPGNLRTTTSGKNIVDLEGCRSPARLQPYIYSNCWVHIPSGQDVAVGDVVSCYPMALATV